MADAQTASRSEIVTFSLSLSPSLHHPSCLPVEAGAKRLALLGGRPLCTASGMAARVTLATRRLFPSRTVVLSPGGAQTLLPWCGGAAAAPSVLGWGGERRRGWGNWGAGRRPGGQATAEGCASPTVTAVCQW